MKRLTIKVAIALGTFIIGIIAVTLWLYKPANQDTVVYSVKLCELARNSSRYDGKIVRMEAFYYQGEDTASLHDPACEEWLRPTCAVFDQQCSEMWGRISNALRSAQSFRVRVDVVGRYSSDAVDPVLNQGGRHVRLFEIMELKGAQPAEAR